MIRAVVVMLIAALALTGCDGDRNTYAPPPPPEVTVARPVQREVQDYLTYAGTTRASQTAELRARVPGFLTEIRFTPGQRVKQGDVLFEIDPREFEAEVARAQALLQAQRAALEGARIDAQLARELAEQRAGPQIDAVVKAARRDVVEAEVRQAEAALEEAMLSLEYTRVVAPIDGRISQNLVDVGNLVGRGDATLLATIVDAQPVYISIEASESDVLRFRARALEENPDSYEPGQSAPGEWRPAELEIGDGGGFAYRGRINYVAPALDPETGTRTVRAEFENEDEAILPGLFARVRFPQARYEALLVPDIALLRDQLGRYALVVNDDNTVEQRRVEIGALEGDLRVVTSGLSAEDRVIVNGLLRARPGSKVNPVESSLDDARGEANGSAR